MELLKNFLGNTELPLFSAFILGLMTAISPCPLATNITAIGYVSRDIDSRRKVFYKGLVYTLGRGISYTAIGLLFYFGAGQIVISRFLQKWGERMLGPLLIIVGLFMLGVLTLRIPGIDRLTAKMEDKARTGFWGVLLLGIVFALAFCPYSGVLYFGMLIPMTISSATGLYLPLVFALGTGIPVVLFAWLIAFSMGSIGNLYNQIKNFEKWFRKIVAVLFVVVGLYYISIYFL